VQQAVISLHLPSTLKLRCQTSGCSVSPENLGKEVRICRPDQEKRKSDAFGKFEFGQNSARICSVWNDSNVSPLPQFVCVFAHCIMRQRRRKRIGGEGRVRGIFSNAAMLDNPLIRPVGHLLPRSGQKGLVEALSLKWGTKPG